MSRNKDRQKAGQAFRADPKVEKEISRSKVVQGSQCGEVDGDEKEENWNVHSACGERIQEAFKVLTQDGVGQHQEILKSNAYFPEGHCGSSSF